MTKFDELLAIITRNKNKGHQSANKPDDQDMEIEVAGSEKSKVPLVSFANDEQDMGLTDQLYVKPKHKPIDGRICRKMGLISPKQSCLWKGKT